LAQVMTCSSIDGMAGFSIVFKCEQFQKGCACSPEQHSWSSPTCCEETACSLASDSSRLACRGAFKFRGAFNAIASLSEEQKRRGVVTHSSGNHALSIALAAKLAGIPAYIVVPTTTPQVPHALLQAACQSAGPAERQQESYCNALVVEPVRQLLCRGAFCPA